MEHSGIQETFLDYSEGTLPEGLKLEVDAHFNHCEECRNAYHEYSILVKLAPVVGASIRVLDEDLSASIMNAVRHEAAFAKVAGKLNTRTSWLVGSLATVNVALVIAVGFLFHQSFSSTFGKQNSALEYAINPVPVDAGHKLISFIVPPTDSLNDIDEHTFVNVHCSYVKNGRSKTVTIGHLLPVQSVYRRELWGRKNLAIKVTEQDYNTIQLARIFGDISLSIAGRMEADPSIQAEPTVPLLDINGHFVSNNIPSNIPAVMFTQTPNGDEGALHVLHRGVWQENHRSDFMVY